MQGHMDPEGTDLGTGTPAVSQVSFTGMLLTVGFLVNLQIAVLIYAFCNMAYDIIHNRHINDHRQGVSER